MGVEYHNGARQHYGPYTEEEQYGAVTRVAGVVKQVVQPIVYDNLPSGTEDDAIAPTIPANAFIVAARLFEETAFDSTSGTTTLDFGLEQPDGTAIDADGIDVDAWTADGSASGWTDCDGALVGASIGSNDGQIVVAASTSDLTAGQGYLILEYIEVPGILA